MFPNHAVMRVRLEASDVDFMERWKPSAILTCMQMAADRHAEMLCCSRKDIEREGFIWIIARLRVDMAVYPHYGDEIAVKTWPGAPDRLTFPRYFSFEAKNGETLGAATTKYMMIDGKTRRFLTPQKADIYRGVEALLEQTNPQPEKIRLHSPTRPAALRTPVFSDIDMNRHMNNARYAEWVADLFGTAAFERQAFRRLQINYVSDGAEGHPISMEVEESEPEGFAVRGTDTVTGKTVFESSGDWLQLP